MIRSVLSLDIALTVGWAFASSRYVPVPAPLERAAGVRAQQPASGAVNFRRWRRDGEDLGGVYSAFRSWLFDQFEIMQPGLFVFEAPLLSHAGGYAGRLLLGMSAIAEEAGHSAKILTREVHISEIKKHATGRGSADKDAMLAAAKAVGWTLTENNEIDAAWLADYYMARQRRDEARGEA